MSKDLAELRQRTDANIRDFARVLLENVDTLNSVSERLVECRGACCALTPAEVDVVIESMLLARCLLQAGVLDHLIAKGDVDA